MTLRIDTPHGMGYPIACDYAILQVWEAPGHPVKSTAIQLVYELVYDMAM